MLAAKGELFIISCACEAMGNLKHQFKFEFSEFCRFFLCAGCTTTITRANLYSTSIRHCLMRWESILWPCDIPLYFDISKLFACNCSCLHFNVHKFTVITITGVRVI